MSIMMQMLEINPYFRPTAKQLLKNKIFDSVRIKENEVFANHKILINADKFEQTADNYGEGVKVDKEKDEQITH